MAPRQAQQGEEAEASLPPPVSKNSTCAICGWDLQRQHHSAAQWVEPIARWAHHACAELWRAGTLLKEPARKDWNPEAWGNRCILHVCSGPGIDPWNLSQRMRDRGLDTDDVDTEDPVLPRDLLDDVVYHDLLEKAHNKMYAG